MKKYGLLGLLLLLLALGASALAMERNTIIIGCDMYAPYTYKDSTGEFVGVDVDFARAAFGRLGYDVQFREIVWENKQSYLDSGEIDCLWSCFTMTGRGEAYTWAGPYLYSRQVAMVRADSDYTELSQLSGKRAAVQASTTAESVLLRHESANVPVMEQVLCFSTLGEAAAALRKNYVDVVVAHEYAIHNLVENSPDIYREMERSLYVNELGVAMALFLFIWMGFVVLRSFSERAILEQSQRRLNTINALSKAYTSMYVVKVPSGEMECIVNPDGNRDLSCKNVSENTRNDLEHYIEPKDHDALEAFLDVRTMEQRLKDQRYIGHTYRSQSGRWYYSIIVAQSYDKKGRLTAFLTATRDCTAEKERELEHQRQLREAVVQARRADAAKTDFLRRMSHDIRTPINGIRGMVEIARHYRGNEEKQEECLDKIMSASGFLLDLVNNVLDMNKLESGEVKLECRPFDVCALIEETAVIIEAQTAEKALTLHTDIRCDGHCRVIGSPLHVRQVLQNLLGNAIRYNKAGGEIFLSSREIALTEENVTYEFTVRDTGIGMSEAFQRHAFEPFAQENADARSSYTGTGLGLAIVKELVEKMGGEITLQSTKNVGTTFTVRLTFAQDANAQQSGDAAQEAGVSIAGMRVLLVEDNDLNMEIAQFMLENEGVQVVKAENGRRAVEIFDASKPGEIEIILMDVMMPVMGGLEATRRIRSLNRPDARTVPIFAMTANAFADDVERSRQAGMNEHLTKPLDADALKKMIGKYRK